MKNSASPQALEDFISHWQRLKEGDRKGLEGIYKCFANDLFQYGLSMVPDRGFVQDCIQEVFIDIWKYHKNLQNTDNVKLYLFKSLTHKIYKETKKEKKWVKEDLQTDFESHFFTECIESQTIDLQREEILQKKLGKALDELPMRQKEVIQNLFFENISYEETSKLMGINLRSVYTLAWKAVSSLKKALFNFGFILCYLFYYMDGRV